MAMRVKLLPTATLVLLGFSWVFDWVGILSIRSGWGYSSTYNVGWKLNEFGAPLSSQLKVRDPSDFSMSRIHSRFSLIHCSLCCP